MITRRPLGSTGLLVAEIGFGALEIGRDWAADVNADPGHLTEGEAALVLNGLLDIGINFIDTAPAYWHSEEFIGKALKSRRAEYILATKVGEHCDPGGSHYDYSREGTRRFIDESLRRLQTDYIDLLQIHSASMETLERGETFAAMEEARQAGKVLHLGMTGGVVECVKALEMGGYETVQFPYNLLNLAAEDRLLPLAREKNAGVIIMRGLAGGKLSAKHKNLKDEKVRNAVAGFLQFADGAATGSPDTLVSLSLRYLISSSEVSTVIVGSRKLKSVQANVESAAHPLTAETLEALRGFAKQCEGLAW